jgi:hypothetical protein
MSSIKGHRFHPFQASQQIPKSSLSTSQAAKVSELSSSPLLDYLGYRFHTRHYVMICVSCGVAIMPQHGIAHAKNAHNIVASRDQRDFWNQTVTEWKVTRLMDVPSPFDRQPVELLKLHKNAYCCNFCRYASLTDATFSKHWGKQHKQEKVPLVERHHKGCVQTFYSHAPCTYFEVDLPIPNSNDLFSIYIKKDVPGYPPFNVTIPSAPREIPPLLYNTRWHEHLSEYISDRGKLRVLTTLAHPRSLAKTPLWKLVWNYMSTVASVAKGSSMRVKCLLTEYPR